MWWFTGLGQLTPALVFALTACRPAARPTAAEPPVASRPTPLVLQLDEGERRVRRWAGGPPFILKVDRRNGGSPDLVMGYEDLAPGYVIPPHRHLHADEIIFVHRGSGVVTLNGEETGVREGATVYIPRNTLISLRATGSDSLGMAFIFSRPGFEDYLRGTSVPEGQPVPPMSEEEMRAMRERHGSHTIYERR